ncbi:MAG: hypothetical protein Q9203_006904 [Teloschistes exilis]
MPSARTGKSRSPATDGELEIVRTLHRLSEQLILILVACWFNHKNLCCKSTATDEAAGKCHWEGSGPFCAAPFGHAKCPSNTKELTNSNYGAGGESVCATGLKSLCCSDPPPYQNCVWQRHNNRFNLGIITFCASGCNAGQIPIATDPTGCITGASFFCCDAPALSPDPAESTVQNYLSTFKNNPSCNNIRAYSKRDLDSGDPAADNDLRAAISTLETRQNAQLTKSQEIALIGALTSAFLGLRNGAQTQLGASVSHDFDQTVGQPFGYSSDSFNTVYNYFPDADPLRLTESLLCTGSHAGAYVSAQAQTTSCACQLPSRLVAGANNPPQYMPHQSKRGLSSTFAIAGFDAVAALNMIRRNLGLSESLLSARNLTKRTIDYSWDINVVGNPASNTLPSIAKVLRGIIDGSLQFMYTRLIRYQRGAEGIVEMAWRIPDGANGDAFRSIPGDQYIVLHGHTTHILIDPLQAQTYPGANAYPGIYQLNVYHGQHFDTQDNRVDGRDSSDDNLRAQVVECNQDANTGQYEYWYPGRAPVDPCENGNGLLIALGDHLRDEGILDGNTYQRVGGNNVPGANHLVEDLRWNSLPFGEGPSNNVDGTVYRLPQGWP